LGWRKEKKAKKIISIQKEEIEAMNENLEKLIIQRTEKLAERSKQLETYAFYNAHKLRAPVATIMGLHNLLKMEKDMKEKEKLFEYLNTSILALENAVQEIQKIVAEDNL
jgi:light-regulated signal transduction histidine kinase (bacteriophytochrome)